jgi:hypothetical protein
LSKLQKQISKSFTITPFLITKVPCSCHNYERISLTHTSLIANDMGTVFQSSPTDL